MRDELAIVGRRDVRAAADMNEALTTWNSGPPPKELIERAERLRRLVNEG